MALRHFLTLRDLSTLELNQVVQRGIELKRKQHNSEVFQPFVGKVMGMIFEKSSTRTRVSFEAGMSQFGGSAIFLSPRDTQLGRGEPIEDSARVISSMLDIVMIRTFGHDIVERFASYSKVPVMADASGWHWAQGLDEARELAEGLGERPFVTTGRQTLPAFAGWADREVLVRVVEPLSEAPPQRWTVIRDRGPYVLEAELALLREYRVDVLLTKDSGGSYTSAKLDACAQLGIPLVVLRRPGETETGWVGSVAEVLAWLTG